MNATLDHLVVAARTLDEGVAWCEATLGIEPGPGGRHELMGTHNRLFSIATPALPQAYFEIIAIDPEASRPDRARWFDLDDLRLLDALAQAPRLVHWVARVDDLHQAAAVLQRHGFDRGRVLQASRSTPTGELRWQITVRDDGRRLLGGALPTLIQWDGVHPSTAMPTSGVTLAALRLRASQPQRLAGALQAIGLTAVSVTTGEDALEVELRTPHGERFLSSRH